MPNALSFVGRLGYGATFLLYPGLITYHQLVYKPNSKKSTLQAKRDDLDTQVADIEVDPDCFNPFSTIPFHNNPELKYMYAGVRMRGYLDENQMNVKDYWYKSYHDSYDHGNKKQHLYNWVSVGVGHH